MRHLPAEARARGAHERAPALRGAPPRKARERVGEVATAVELVFEGAQRAGSGTGEAVGEAVGEALGEARVELLVGDAGEAVVGVAGESGAPGGSMTHRDRLLEDDADAAARGVFDGLLGLALKSLYRKL